jgi:predicted NBD/HSP70 family sugar kinase
VAGELSFVIDQMTRQQLDYVETWVDQEEHNWLDLGFSPLISGSCATRFGLVANVAKAKNLSFDEVSGEQIYEWARQGDEICINALEDLYYAIAKECSRLYITLDPDVILIGGGISSEPAYVEGINRYADKIKHIFPIYEGMQIKPCKFRNDSNLIGALFNFLQIHNLVD